MISIRSKLILLALCSFVFFSCGTDDGPLFEGNFPYPVYAKFVGIQDLQPIEVFTNVDGLATALNNEDTDLDEDPFFATVDANFREIIFISDTDARVVVNEDVILTDTFDITYTYANNFMELAFDLPDVGFPVTLLATATGTPLSFKLESQAYKFFQADGGTYNSVQYNIESIEDLKAELEDENEPFSSFANQYYNQVFEEE